MLAKAETQIDLRHYVLRTEPGAEFKAERHLKYAGFKPWVPSETLIQVRRTRTYWGEQGRKHEVTRPIFRGYVFIPLNAAWSFGPLYSTPGLCSSPFLLICGNPAVVPPHEVERLQALEIGRKGSPVQRLPYKVGDNIQIMEGPFRGFTAEIAKLDDDARIELLMFILGAKTKMHLSVEQIAPLN